MRRLLLATVTCLAVSHAAHAAVFTINTNPLDTATLTPGRDIIGGEPSISFNPATDVFALNLAAFGVTPPLTFASGLTTNIPPDYTKVIVVQNGPPLAAGTAANAIAARLTSGGPGFFVYFNSGLDLPRLVFSTNLDDETADLAILARMTNLTGLEGRAVLATFSAADFVPTAAAVPEASTLALAGIAALGLASRLRLRSR